VPNLSQCHSINSPTRCSSKLRNRAGTNVYYPFLASTITVYGTPFLGPLEGEVKTTHRILTYGAELVVTYFLIRGIQNCSSRNPVKEQKRIPGQNSVRKLWPRYIGGQNGFHVMVRRLCSGMLTLGSGMHTFLSG
jgi:hypothetical protein